MKRGLNLIVRTDNNDAIGVSTFDCAGIMLLISDGVGQGAGVGL
jgi:hypothetical protein